MSSAFEGFTVVDDLDEPRRPQPKSRRRTARPVSEASVKDFTLKQIKIRGGYAIAKHMTGAGTRGTPDVLACITGRMVVIECKTEGNCPTAAQVGEMRKWQDAGALVGWIRTRAELDNLLDHLDDATWSNDFEHPGDGRGAGDPW